MRPISFVCPISDIRVARDNLLASEAILSGRHELITSEGYTNVSKALNDGVARASHQLICAVHQDVRLPPSWEEDLFTSLAEIEREDTAWGVLGVAGTRYGGPDQPNPPIGHVNDRGHDWGSPAGLPARVDTIDELLAVFHRGELAFDEDLPGPHMYAVDLCLQATAKGLNCYAILAYCHHNSSLIGAGSDAPGFLEVKEYIRRKWSHRLPIATTCDVIYPE